MIESSLRSQFPDLFRFIDEDKVAVSYSPYSRSFYISLYENIGKQLIYFCPWTGSRLPRPLNSEFEDLLESKNLSILEPESWPSSWRSEQWWIDAGR